MQLNPELIEKFKKIHKGIKGFEKYSEDQVVEITNGVANYYLTLFKIDQRIKKDSNKKI
jgi:hypothetical protein